MKQKNRDFLAELFGAETVERFLTLEERDPEIHTLIDEFTTEKVWMRPGLPLRERSLITISSQIANGQWDQVERHMKSFLHLGGTKEELKEVCIHLSVYCGFPKMLSAKKILDSI